MCVYLPEPVLFRKRVVSVDQGSEFCVPHLHAVACVDDSYCGAVLSCQTHAKLLNQSLHFLFYEK